MTAILLTRRTSMAGLVAAEVLQTAQAEKNTHTTHTKRAAAAALSSASPPR